MAITSSLIPLIGRRMGGGNGFNFDAFWHVGTQNRFKDESHILVTNMSTYLDLEYDGSVLSSSAISGFPHTRVIDGSDEDALNEVTYRRHVFFRFPYRKRRILRLADSLFCASGKLEWFNC